MYVMTSSFAVLAFALIGLCIGSFLNVVIYRLPKMLEAQFEGVASNTDDAPAPLTLCHPPSRCGHCGHSITWFENIPVLSYLFLRGKCSVCHAPIGLRYPLVELAASAVFGYCAWRWYFSWTAAAYALFGAALLCASLIDWDTTYLPDDITVPLTWAGLIAAGLHVLPSVNLSQSLAGACAGYLSLWLIYWAFKLTTGREGMGYGDFKLYAAIGAWLGWQALIPTVLVAASLGVVAGLLLKWTHQERQIDGVTGYIPFGPFLAFGAALELITSWQL
ncbi:MAG: A24 family peptidase [Cytophagales bacterium]|nr:A24 family peptidase [Cytophagales bacterium]